MMGGAEKNMQVWLYTLVSVVIVSALSLVGVATLALRRGRLKQITLTLVSFAVGALLGDAFIHLLPQAFRDFGAGLAVSLYALAGMLLFFVLEKFLRWRHCHDAECDFHMGEAARDGRGRIHPVVVMNLVGDGVHNLIDGMIIGASYLVSVPLGLATTLAVVLHEIPQEFGDFGVLVQGGLSVRAALGFNFLSSLTAVAGAVISLAVGTRVHGFAALLVPLTAGGFLYIAGSDLIPELHHQAGIRRSLGQLAAIVAGIGVMVALTFLE